MRKEMLSKLNSVAEEFRKVSDLQMAETTKRTIQENVSINQQLGKVPTHACHSHWKPIGSTPWLSQH